MTAPQTIYITKTNGYDWQKANAELDKLINGGFKIDKVIIAGHGSVGEAGPFNSSVLSNPASDEFKFLTKLSTVLTSDARVDLRTCWTASGAGGQQFLIDLAKFVDAKVTACDDKYALKAWGKQYIAAPDGTITLLKDHGPYTDTFVYTLEKETGLNAK